MDNLDKTYNILLMEDVPINKTVTLSSMSYFNDVSKIYIGDRYYYETIDGYRISQEYNVRELGSMSSHIFSLLGEIDFEKLESIESRLENLEKQNIQILENEDGIMQRLDDIEKKLNSEEA